MFSFFLVIRKRQFMFSNALRKLKHLTSFFVVTQFLFNWRYGQLSGIRFQLFSNRNTNLPMQAVENIHIQINNFEQLYMQPRENFRISSKHRGPKIVFIDRLWVKFPRGKCRCQATVRNKNGCPARKDTSTWKKNCLQATTKSRNHANEFNISP